MKLHLLLAALFAAVISVALGSHTPRNGDDSDEEEEKEESFIRVSAKKREPSRSPQVPQRRVNSIEEHVRKHNIPEKVKKRSGKGVVTWSDE